MPETEYQLIAQINSNVNQLLKNAQNDRDTFSKILSDLVSIKNSLVEVQDQLDGIAQAVEPPPPAVYLQFTWGVPSPVPSVDLNINAAQPRNHLFLKENNSMPVQLTPGQTVGFTVAPLNAQGGASSATLSNLSFTTSDATVFTVAPDPNNANGGIVTALNPAVLPDAAAITATATATEPDGVTTETISGTDTVTVNSAAPPPPPPPVAASLAFTWAVPASKKK
jgi:hypothetical protein